MSAAVALYERTAALQIIEEWISENEESILAAGGEMPPELEALLNAAELDFKEKVERVALFVRELAATAKAIGEEEKRIASRRKAKEAAAERLEEYLRRNMEAVGQTRIEGLLCTVAVQANPPSVLCANPEALYDDWAGLLVKRVETVTYQIERAEVLRRAKEGLELPDGLAVVHGSHLRIR